jgi:hypothetical protein
MGMVDKLKTRNWVTSFRDVSIVRTTVYIFLKICVTL